jgi:hypothetical protein
MSALSEIPDPEKSRMTRLMLVYLQLSQPVFMLGLSYYGTDLLSLIELNFLVVQTAVSVM